MSDPPAYPDKTLEIGARPGVAVVPFVLHPLGVTASLG